MNLKDFAAPLAAENKFLKASFGGFAGSGKSRTATEFIIGAYKQMKCKSAVLIIDNEKGGRFLQPIFEAAGIEVLLKETVELADVLHAFEYLKKGEISFLFIDSLTKVWYNYVNQYKAKNGRNGQPLAFMTLEHWGKILPAWQAQFADKFVACEGNIIFTGRGGNTYDMEEDQNGKKQFVKSGVKMKMAGETPFEPDLNIWMTMEQDLKEDGTLEVYREAMIMKDRSNTIDGKVFKNPTYKAFAPFMDFLLAAKIGKVVKATDTSNFAPKEDDYDDRKRKREILVEKIKAEFDKRQFGTSKEDKAAKLAIFQKTIGTTSGTELEGYNLDKLSHCYEAVLNFFVGFDQTEAQDRYDYIANYEPK